MPEPLVIAVVGAESTGKTALCRALAEHLAHSTGRRCTWVPEALRGWCESQGRTPLRHEQPSIAVAQTERIAEAVCSHDVVVADTTALMTAVYSDMLFDDRSLVPFAVAQQRRCSLTLLTALDIAWVPDGLQRDGPHVRMPVDALVREWLIAAGLEWSVVSGEGHARLQSALDALAPRLRAWPAPGRGLFMRLAARNAAPLARPWFCESCDSPECEHALLMQQRRG